MKTLEERNATDGTGYFVVAIGIILMVIGFLCLPLKVDVEIGSMFLMAFLLVIFGVALAWHDQREAARKNQEAQLYKAAEQRAIYRIGDVVMRMSNVEKLKGQFDYERYLIKSDGSLRLFAYIEIPYGNSESEGMFQLSIFYDDDETFLKKCQLLDDVIADIAKYRDITL